MMPVGDHPEGEPPDRRALLAVGGVLLVAFLVGIGISRYDGGKATRDPGGGGVMSVTVPMLPEPGAGLTPPEKDKHPESAPLSYDEFMGFLGGMQEDPLAAEFAAEFQQDPALAAVARNYRRPENAGRPGTMKEFYHALAQLPEFRRLVARFASRPGADALMARLNLIPGLKQAARSGSPTAAAAAVAKARSGFRSPTKPGAGFHLASLGGAAFVSAPGAPGAKGAAGARPTASAASVGSSELAAAVGAGQGLRSIDKPPGDGDDFATTPLGAINAAGPSTTRDTFMSICIKQSGITRAECESINAHLGPHGIWESCWLANLYDKCVQLCASVPELQCTGNAPGWTGACITVEPATPDRALTCDARCRAAGRTDCGPDPATGTGTGTGTGTAAAPGTYTIRPGDNMTAIVMRVYGITDPRTAYLTALELYRYGENHTVSGNNPYNPNLIFPGRTLSLPPLPELGNMTITRP